MEDQKTNKIEILPSLDGNPVVIEPLEPKPLVIDPQNVLNENKPPVKHRAPGGGRVRDEVKYMFRNLLKESNALERLRNIINKGKNDEIFLKALQICLDRGYGKVVQSVELDGGQGGDVIQWLIVGRTERGIDP